MLVFDKFKQYLLLPIKDFYFWMLINFYLLGIIKHLRLLTIDYAYHLTSNLC